MISLREISAGYTPGIDILKSISIDVGRAEIVTLLGPNGCGKSTLLKCIAGFLRPRSGQMLLDGSEIGALPVHLKVRHCALGFVPQTDNVFTNLSVRENLLIGGQFMREPSRRQRMDALCDLYPMLGRKFNQPAAALSGGERQILALGRALMPAPKTLLLDEPSAGLSPKMLNDVFAAILQIRKLEEVAILMVEQNAMEALRISDRAYILALGNVALTGKSAELMHDDRVRELYLGGRAA